MTLVLVVSNPQFIKPILQDDLMYGALTTEPWNFGNAFKVLYFFAKIKQYRASQGNISKFTDTSCVLVPNRGTIGGIIKRYVSRRRIILKGVNSSSYWCVLQEQLLVLRVDQIGQYRQLYRDKSTGSSLEKWIKSSW